MNVARRVRFWAVCSAISGVLSFAPPDAGLRAETPADGSPPAAVDFTRDIKPILSNNCFFCHGPDAEQRKGGTDGLRLDTLEGARADLGDGKSAIAPGRPEESVLLRRVTSLDADEVMPPKATNKQLSPREIDLLAAWIRQGAEYAGHWSYQKPARPTPPALQDSAAQPANWPRNPIDSFLLARLERERLKPAPEADRRTLIRRLSLDLTGLPPTLAEVDAFATDADPLAYERLVDRLLAAPAYGEHWAQLWLDLARYADSAGYADDPPRTIWLYRDYVIRSLNANKPFDQFTIEQIAGDLLPNPSEEQLIATAFHRNTQTNNEGGTNDEEFRNVAVVDRVNTTLAVWMATTIACAQCHNHKYDPLSQEDYFRFFAFFNNSEDADRRDESPTLAVYSDAERDQRAKLEAELAKLEETLRTPTPELASAERQWDAQFPRDLAWRALMPTAAKADSGAAIAIADDGAVRASGGAANDTYRLELPLPAGKLRAVRLEALPDDALPAKGPGFGGGNFVLTRFTAAIAPPQGDRPSARYVRVELPGKAKYLHLAEVQVFSGGENLATRGAATQSSTDFDGPAKLAIDGNTDGRYHEARSTSHTAGSDDPWWEVDLLKEQPLERIVIWNRTDGGTEERLKGFRVVVLNERREPVWRQEGAPPPRPSAEFSLGGPRTIEFARAVADFSQPGFDAANVLDNKDPKKLGWAIAGEVGKPHALTLLARDAAEAPAGAKLIVALEQDSQFPQHTLGRFRLSVTEDERALELAATPSPVLSALLRPGSDRAPAEAALVTKHFLSIAPQLEPLRRQLAETKKRLDEIKPTTVPIMRERPAAQLRVTKLQHRGNFLDLGKEVTAETPPAFPALPADAPRNRLALARWLVDERNPLTARVLANRCWEQIFGVGIVASSEEFGSQGDQPFHPELLDWLATELVRTGWDVKAFLKLLVTSAAYRQSSRVSPELEERDPDNRLLARGPRFRLSAEVVRDQALAVSGLLSRKMLGPPVKPPQPSFGLNAAFGGGVDWQTSEGEDRYRRALYTTWRRSSPYPSMATFDAPNREVCTVRRARTNTPLQALVTLNDPVYVEAAQALARRLLAEGGPSATERAGYGFRLCLSHAPSAAESARLVALYDEARASYADHPDDARRMATEPFGPAPANVDIADLAAWTVVCNVLFNLDETLMKP